MRRAIYTLAVTAILGLPVTTTADSTRGELLAETALAARGELIRVQNSLRDTVAGATDGARALVGALDGVIADRIPDVSVLRVEPVAGNPTSSGFGWREDPITHYAKFHGGADIRGDHGTPVRTAGDGVVTFAGQAAGYGNVVFVDHGGGVVTRYAHLRRIETKLAATVRAGQRIGQIGSTGRATGPHLHFEVRLDGQPVDPPTAMAVAATWRESPDKGRDAAKVLAPTVQSKKQSEDWSDRARGTRPGRPERIRRPAKPLS
jgi:murein DD-endopeptidase MepM/ murein hydrolase activator NlpD